MKKVKIFVLVLPVVLMTSSCFLFRPTHERCPAYGNESIEQNQIDAVIEPLVEENS